MGRLERFVKCKSVISANEFRDSCIPIETLVRVVAQDRDNPKGEVTRFGTLLESEIDWVTISSSDGTRPT
jgi:hypothetical protein